MYLVHARLLPATPGGPLPPQTGEWVLAAAAPGERVEHVTCHPDARAGPALGVYLLAAGLEQAEAVTAIVCARTLARRRELADWSLLSVCAPLIPPVLF